MPSDGRPRATAASGRSASASTSPTPRPPTTPPYSSSTATAPPRRSGPAATTARSTTRARAAASTTRATPTPPATSCRSTTATTPPPSSSACIDPSVVTRAVPISGAASFRGEWSVVEVREHGPHSAVRVIGRRQIEPGEDVRDVLLHRDRGQHERRADGRVRQALRHQAQHLPLARGERLDAAMPACPGEQLPDDLRVHGGAAGRHPFHRVEERVERGHPV